MLINNSISSPPQSTNNTASENVNTKGTGLTNVAEFTPQATNQHVEAAMNAPAQPSMMSALAGIQQMINALITSFGLAANNDQALSETEQVNHSQVNYADSLEGFETSNMTRSTEDIANLTALRNGKRVLNQVGNNKISAARLEAALKLAADNGFKLEINGEVNVSSPIKVNPNKSFEVDAKDALFVAANGLDGDMISIDANSSSSFTGDDDIKVKWEGGIFDMSNAKNAVEASPFIDDLVKGNADRANRRGTASTTDALSIRGVSNNQQRIKEADVKDVLVIGLPVDLPSNKSFRDISINDLELSDNNRQTWPDAGGDSGVFIQGLDRAVVKDSEFFGIRDAAIYATASPDGTAGSNYTIENNVIRRAFTGIPIKRGANNITIDNNKLTDVVIGISTREANLEKSTTSDISITNNTLNTVAQGILLSRANDVTVTGNTIKNLGNAVGREDDPRTNSKDYEGIALEGVRTSEGGVNTVRDNTIESTSDSGRRSKDIIGIVERPYTPPSRFDYSPRAPERFTDGRLEANNTFNGNLFDSKTA